MVYESDFYTTRRPYRTTPSYSTYSSSTVPSRQVRILPGLGKVHIVHTYDRIVPYVGHKRLTVVTSPPKVYSTRRSVLQKEYDWIESKLRPWVAYSPTNRYLDSDSSVRYVYVRNPVSGLTYHSQYLPSRYYNYYRIIRPLSTYVDYYWPYYRPLSSYADYWPLYRSLSYIDDLPIYRSLRLQRIFDDETRLIRAQTASLLKQVHLPVPRIRSWSVEPLNRYGSLSPLPVKYSNDTYIHRLLTVSPTSKVEYATYYTEPVKKYIGGLGQLSCVSYAGDKSYNRRRPLAIFEDAVRNDIQLLSYYITKFRQEKAQPKEIKVPLSPARPSRIFNVHKPLEDPVVQEIKDLREARAARLAKIYDETPAKADVEEGLKAKKKKEEARLAEERALAEEQARKEAQAKKEEAARKAELARQEQLAAQAAAERAAELERQAEIARQEELAKQAEIEKARQLEEEKARLEEQRRLEEEAKAEEERQQLLRLEEIARQAEEEKEAELARQAAELAELARQEAERAEQERLEREEQEKAQKEAELAELERQEKELAELERQEKELAELAEKAKEEAEIAAKEAQGALEEAEAAPEDEAVVEEAAEEVVAAAEESEPAAEESEAVAEEAESEPVAEAAAEAEPAAEEEEEESEE